MTRVNLLLIVALVLSCLYLVRTAYDSRRLFTELDRAKNETARLATERVRLEAERARGFARTSPSPGRTRPSECSRTGFGSANGARRSNGALLSRAMKVLTMRSSSE